MLVSAASARPRRPTFWGRLGDSFLCSNAWTRALALSPDFLLWKEEKHPGYEATPALVLWLSELAE